MLSSETCKKESVMWVAVQKGSELETWNQYLSDEHYEPKLDWFPFPFLTLFCQCLYTIAAKTREMTTTRQFITRREYLSFVYTSYTHALPSTHSSQPSLHARHSKWSSYRLDSPLSILSYSSSRSCPIKYF